MSRFLTAQRRLKTFVSELKELGLQFLRLIPVVAKYNTAFRYFQTFGHVIILEKCPCHLEVTESIVLSLRELNLQVTVITNSANARINDAHIRGWEALGARTLLLPANAIYSRLVLSLASLAADCLIFNSSYDYLSRRYIFSSPLPRQVKARSLWVQHEVGDVHRDLFLQDYAASGRLIALVPCSIPTVPTFFPVYLKNDDVAANEDETTRICVPGGGGVDFSLVFRALANCRIDAEMHITGWIEPDELFAVAAAEGVRSQISAYGRVPASYLLRIAQDSSAILGPTAVSEYGFDRRVSGARQLSVSLQVPLIITKSLANDLALPSGSYIDSSSGLESAFKSLSRVNFMEQSKQRRLLAEVWARDRSNAKAVWADAMKSFGC